MGYSKLATERYPAYSGNYTSGRRGYKIEAITIHHMAGVLTAKECGAIWQKKDRKGSSHYGIGKNGEIANYVDENNIAWTNSNWESNCKSVTIETSNSKKNGDWPVSDKTLESLIKLVADIAKRNNLGTLVRGKNLTWHSMFHNTACPGPYLLSKIDYIIQKANEINKAGDVKLKIAKIEKKKVVLNVNANLWDLEFASYNEAKVVKSYKKGDVIDNVVAIAEHPLGSKYYITEYSYNNKINNGFNVVDCDDYVEEPEEEQIPDVKPTETPDTEQNDKEPINTNDDNEQQDEPEKNWFVKVLDIIIELFKKIINR